MKEKLIILICLMIITKSYSQCFLKSTNMIDEGYIVYYDSDSQYSNQLIERANTYLMKASFLKIKYGFYFDNKNGNAMALRSKDKDYDGQIYIGENLFNNLVLDSINLSDKQDIINLYNISKIVAHEYAHILQYKKGKIYKSKKYSELQADYIAGYLVSFLIANLTPNQKEFIESYERALAFFRSLGDTNFANINHHGEPRERALAFSAGSSRYLNYWKAANLEPMHIQSMDTVWDYSVGFIHWWYGNEDDAQFKEKE